MELCGVALSERGAVSLVRRRQIAASIGIGALLLTILPERIGFQDLGALLARQPGVAKRWQQHLIASPFGTIHAAMFSLPRPIGTTIPHPPIYALANFDPADITGSIGKQPLGDGNAPLQFPKANRKAKGDSLISRPREPLPPLPPVLAIEPAPEADAETAIKKDETAARFDPYSQYEYVTAPDERSPTPDVDLPYADIPPSNITPAAPSPGPVKDATRLYFGVDPLASAPEGVSPWAPGEAPVVLASRGDPDIKESALHVRRRRSVRARPAKASRTKARSPARTSGRIHRPKGSRSLARRAPRRRNVSRTRCTSKRAAKRCVGRSRSRRW